MRRLYIVWSIFVFCVLSGLPTMAQDTTIANIIQNRSASTMDFTILQEFLDAAPAVRNRLNRSGAYTLFAPNDLAFRNLESAIGLDLATLLTDVEVVTAILNYHIIDSNLSDQALRQRDGQVIPTRLQNAFVGIRVNSESTIVVNNVVEVIEANLTASNGTVHVLNDVLLNRVVNTLIDDKLHTTVIATPTPTSTPISTPTPSTVQTSETIASAYVRLANFVTDVPQLTIAVEADEAFISDIAFGEMSGFAFLAQGLYTTTIYSDDANSNSTLDIELDLTLLNGDFVTIVVVGSVEEDTVRAIQISEDFARLDEDEARLTVLHALDSAPPIHLLIDEQRMTDPIRFGEVDVVDVDAAEVSISAVETRNVEAVFIASQNQLLAEGAFYFVAIIGIPDAAMLAISQISVDDLNYLREDSTVTNDAENDVRQGTIVNVLDDEDNFTILIAALSVADRDVINILGNVDGDPVTFLAPNDLAFRNLMTTIGYSQDRLFNNNRLLTDILLYHIIDEPLESDAFRAASGTSIETELDPVQAFFVQASNSGTIFLNGSVEIILTDIQANNGIIQVIDDVLLPESALDILGL